MMTDEELRERLETMLAQAARFAAADEPTEARARVRQVLELVEVERARSFVARESLAGIDRRARRMLERYEAARVEWVKRVQARSDAWVARELGALRAPITKHE